MRSNTHSNCVLRHPEPHLTPGRKGVSRHRQGERSGPRPAAGGAEGRMGWASGSECATPLAGHAHRWPRPSLALQTLLVQGLLHPSGDPPYEHPSPPGLLAPRASSPGELCPHSPPHLPAPVPCPGLSPSCLWISSVVSSRTPGVSGGASDDDPQGGGVFASVLGATPSGAPLSPGH